MPPAIAISAAALLTTLVAAPALAQFSSDPANQRVLINDARTSPTAVLHAPAGGFYLGLYTYNQVPPSTYSLQRLDARGVPVWPAPMTFGVASGDEIRWTGHSMVTDAQDNVVFAYTDRYFGATQPSRVWLQKVTPDGQLPWGPDGVEITSHLSTTQTQGARSGVVCLTDGSYGVLFSRIAPGYAYTLCVQKVSPTGQRLWNNGQAIVTYDPAISHTAVTPIAGTNGSMIVAVTKSIHPASPAFTGLALQRLDGATGAPTWNNGQYVTVEAENVWWDRAHVISDQQGGAFVSWWRPGPNQDECHLQRVDANGNLLFGPNGVSATTGVPGRERSDQQIVFDPAAQRIYMSYAEKTHDGAQSGVFAQAFSAQGQRLWGDAGRAVLPLGDLTRHDIRLSLSDSGPLIAWHQSLTPPPSPFNSPRALRASRLLPDGSFAWPAQVITVNSRESFKNWLTLTPRGPLVAAYTESSESSADLVISRINPDGSLGQPCGTADFNNDGDSATDADIEAFFACLAGACCPTCGSADFNNDGDSATDADIESFFRVLAGGPC